MHTYVWNTRLVVGTLKFSMSFLFCVFFYWLLLLLLRSDQDCIRAQGRADPYCTYTLYLCRSSVPVLYFFSNVQVLYVMYVCPYYLLSVPYLDLDP